MTTVPIEPRKREVNFQRAEGSERSKYGSGGAGPRKTWQTEDQVFKLGQTATGMGLSLHCQIDNLDRAGRVSSLCATAILLA